MDEATTDVKLMRRCLELAKQAEGRTSPNPLVGSVVIDKEGQVVGEGFHARAGEPHAEVHALIQAADRAKGGTLYVNLEPCSHFGRTPPCADFVIESGIKRVVVGMQDPNPKVLGEGIKKLQSAGIRVDLSELEKECQYLNRAFIKHIRTGMPWLSLKMASTLDGRIADRFGKSRWISGAEARKFAHQLRNTHDCVLVGASTAVIDDPELNVRDLPDSRNPHRAVLDPSLRIKPNARMCELKDDDRSFTYIFTTAAKIKEAPEFSNRVKLIDLMAQDSSGSTMLQTALRWLGGNGIQSVLCEGGGRLAASCMEEQLVDEIYWIVAPKLLVDAQAVPVLSGQSSSAIDRCIELSVLSYDKLGKDLLITAKPVWK